MLDLGCVFGFDILLASVFSKTTTVVTLFLFSLFWVAFLVWDLNLLQVEAI
jgi:hypothetical protein